MPRILWGELLRAEDVPLYSICPDCLVLRLVVKGGGFECSRCWWNEYKGGDVIEKSVAPEVILDKLRLTRAEVLVVDGPDPLPRILGDSEWSKLLERVREMGVIRVVKTLGLDAGLDGLGGLADAVLLELAVFASDKPPSGYLRVYDAIEALRESGFHGELLFPYARRGAKSILADIARKGLPVTVDVREESLWDEAYNAVKKLRDDKLPVFLHRDTSYTVVDYNCPSCGEVLVERRPWRIARRYDPPPAPTLVRCPRCGALVPLLDRRPARRPALRRRVVIL